MSSMIEIKKKKPSKLKKNYRKFKLYRIESKSNTFLIKKKSNRTPRLLNSSFLPLTRQCSQSKSNVRSLKTVLFLKPYFRTSVTMWEYFKPEPALKIFPPFTHFNRNTFCRLNGIWYATTSKVVHSYPLKQNKQKSRNKSILMLCN